MRRLAVFVLAAAVLPAHAASLLVNGNLDLTQSVEIVPGFFLPKPAGWTTEGSRTLTGPYNDELSSEPWAGPAPTPVTNDGTGLAAPNGCSGFDCAVFFKPFTGGGANGAATGHLYQDHPATPGFTYIFEGWAGAEANVLAQQLVFAIDFLNGANTVIESHVLDLVAAGLFTPNGQPFNYKLYSIGADAPVGTAFVRARVSMIDAMANPAGGGQAFVVDDFTLTELDAAIPEPTTTVLLGAGLLALAVSARRRR